MRKFTGISFDRALDGVLDGIERRVRNAADVLEEYPAQPAQQAQETSVRTADWTQHSQVAAFWAQLNLQHHKDTLEALAQQEGVTTDKSQSHKAESMLRELTTLLLQAPDPAPFLSHASEMQHSITELQRDNRKLQLDAEAAEREAGSAAAVVSQAQKLEAARAELHAQLQTEVEKGQELRRQLEEAAPAAAQQQGLQEALQQSHALQRRLQAENERLQSALFAARAQKEEQEASHAADTELLARDLEAARSHAQEAEKRWERREARAAALEAESSGMTSSPGDTFVLKLQQELQRGRAQLQDQGREHAHALALLQDRAASAELQATQLQEELSGRPDEEAVEQLRQQLRELGALVDAHALHEGWQPPAADAKLHTPAALQSLLQVRNRHLAGEVVTLRQAGQEQEAAAQKLQQQLAELQARASEQAALILQLESDLQGANSNHRGGSDGQEAAAEAAEQPPAASDMLGIITSQRDRFRRRVQQLEEQLAAAQGSVQSAETKLQAASADNVRLYEKLRYLQRYSARRQGSGEEAAGGFVRVDDAGVAQPQDKGLQHRFSCGPVQLGVGVPPDDGGTARAVRSRGAQRRIACFALDDDADDNDLEHPPLTGDLEQRYSKAYEARLNPFAEFQASEGRSRLKRLRMHDRALLTTSRVLLASGVARVFASIYLVLLHIFVAVLLYLSASAGSAQVDSLSASTGTGSASETSLQAAQAVARKLLMHHHAWPARPWHHWP